MSTELRIRELTGTWVVRAGGAVLAETKGAMELSEGRHEPVVYFPRSDIAMAFLDTSDTATRCPHKGDASYFSIQTKSQTLTDAAWSYESPQGSVAPIAGYLAFDPDKVAIERL